jgi:hypothetical protein
VNRCNTCRHWKVDTDSVTSTELCNPTDPDTFEPMVMPFEVRECLHPKLQFCERPITVDGFAVADGSTYYAGLFTAQDFGCVRHEVK